MKILVIQGHPDPEGGHFLHAMADAYAKGACQAGHEVERITVSALDFPLLKSKKDWTDSEPTPDIADAQQRIRDAEHIVLFYPLWLGTLPAILKAFFEQVFRPEYAISMDSETGKWQRLLKGRSARVVVTMGMPALAYRWLYRAHSLKSLERNVLKFVGIEPIRETLIGMVESSDRARERDLVQMEKLGRRGL